MAKKLVPTKNSNKKVVKTKLTPATLPASAQPAAKPAKITTRYIFIRDRLSPRSSFNDKGQPVGCMAYQASLTDTGYHIRYGLSCLNPEDRFDRKIGRSTAADRMVHGANPELKQKYPAMSQSVMINADQLPDALSSLFSLLSLENLPTRLHKNMIHMSQRIRMGEPNFITPSPL